MAVNPATGFVARQRTTSAGFYDIPQLAPATYTVTISAPEFRTVVHSGVVVDALATQNLDIHLEIGSSEFRI